MKFKGRQEERKSDGDTQEGENATIETDIVKVHRLQTSSNQHETFF